MITISTERRPQLTSAHGAPLSKQAFRHISQAILRGDYSSGDRLDNRRLARELGMSLNPIREAILRLRDVGLVEVSPARYTKVVDFSGVESQSAIGYVGGLAGLALRTVVPALSEHDREGVTAASNHLVTSFATPGYVPAAMAFLAAVANRVPHPREATHLAETALLAHCTLRFSGFAPHGDALEELRAAAAEITPGIREVDPEAAEHAVRGFFDLLHRSVAREHDETRYPSSEALQTGKSLE